MIHIVDEKTNVTLAEMKEATRTPQSFVNGQRIVLFGDKAYKVKRIIINESSPSNVTVLVEDDGKKLLID